MPTEEHTLSVLPLSAASRVRWALVGFLATMLLGGAHLALGAGHAFNEGWLRGDSGWYLAQIQQLIEGRMLYSEVATPYGPIPYYWQACFAYCFGNTPAVFLWGQIFVLGFANAIASMVLRTSFSSGSAILLLAVAILPFHYRGIFSIYTPWVVLQLMGMVALWRSPVEKRAGLEWGIGMLLGIGQLLKFGHFVLFGAGLLLVDLLAVAAVRERKEFRFSHLFRRWIRFGSGFFIIEIIWSGILLVSLPSGIAWDAIWPAYQKDAYQSVFGPNERLWSGLFHLPTTVFLGRLLPMLLLLVILVACLIRQVSGRGSNGERKVLGWAIGPFSFLVGSVILLTNVNAFFLYFWLWSGSIVWAYSLALKVIKLGAVAVGSALLLLLPLSWWNSRHGVPCEVGPGIKLVVGEERISALRELDLELQRRPELRDGTLVLRWRGLVAFRGIQTPGRHVYPLPGWVRGHEGEQLERDLSQLRYILAERNSKNAALLNSESGSIESRFSQWSELPVPYRELLAGRSGEAFAIGDHWICVPLEVSPTENPSSGS